MHSTYLKKAQVLRETGDPKATTILDTSSQNYSLQYKANKANNATQRAEAPRPNNTGMPDNLKSGIESLSGFSMDDVRVHYNSSKPATVQALAYTQGTDIHVAPGQEKHLPHEAWHVAQQMAGRVSPTTNINGMPVNDNAALEQEADVMGEKAMLNKEYNCQNKKILQNSNFPIQCYIKQGEYILSETKKYAIKSNEASTIYVNANLPNEYGGIKKLHSLGIEPEKEQETISGLAYFKYNQSTTPSNLQPFIGTFYKDSPQDLSSQKKIISTLISICEDLEKIIPISEAKQNEIYECHRNPSFSKLGRDIFYDLLLIKQWLSKQKEFDSSLNRIVLNDLNLRLSQIESEEIILEKEKKSLAVSTWQGWKTTCNTSDAQRRSYIPDAPLSEITIKTPEEAEFNNLVGWTKHVTTIIDDDGQDKLCIEDAAGKSYDSTHLAKAHWFARIYGQEGNISDENQTTATTTKKGGIDITIPKGFSSNNFCISFTFKERTLIISFEKNKFSYEYKPEGVVSNFVDDFLFQTALSVINQIFIRKNIDIKEYDKLIKEAPTPQKDEFKIEDEAPEDETHPPKTKLFSQPSKAWGSCTVQ